MIEAINPYPPHLLAGLASPGENPGHVWQIPAGRDDLIGDPELRAQIRQTIDDPFWFLDETLKEEISWSRGSNKKIHLSADWLKTVTDRVKSAYGQIARFLADWDTGPVPPPGNPPECDCNGTRWSLNPPGNTSDCAGDFPVYLVAWDDISGWESYWEPVKKIIGVNSGPAVWLTVNSAAGDLVTGRSDQMDKFDSGWFCYAGNKANNILVWAPALDPTVCSSETGECTDARQLLVKFSGAETALPAQTAVPPTATAEPEAEPLAETVSAPSETSDPPEPVVIVVTATVGMPADLPPTPVRQTPENGTADLKKTPQPDMMPVKMVGVFCCSSTGIYVIILIGLEAGKVRKIKKEKAQLQNLRQRVSQVRQPESNFPGKSPAAQPQSPWRPKAGKGK